MKTKTKLYILLISFIIGVVVVGYSSTLNAYKVDTSTVKHQEKLVGYSSIKAYIVEQAEKNGLDPVDIMMIIQGESHFNENAVGVNTNKTADLGLIQVNSIHIKSGSITLKCAGETKCAIDWLIKKRLADGNYSSWVVANNLGIK